MKNGAISLLNRINATIGIRDVYKSLTVIIGCQDEFYRTILIAILTIALLLSFLYLRIAVQVFADIAALSRVLNISHVDNFRVVA